MNEDGFGLAGSRLYEVIDLLGGLVVLVKKSLILAVLPKESQVDDSY